MSHLPMGNITNYLNFYKFVDKINMARRFLEFYFFKLEVDKELSEMPNEIEFVTPFDGLHIDVIETGSVCPEQPSKCLRKLRFLN